MFPTVLAMETIDCHFKQDMICNIWLHYHAV